MALDALEACRSAVRRTETAAGALRAALDNLRAVEVELGVQSPADATLVDAHRLATRALEQLSVLLTNVKRIPTP